MNAIIKKKLITPLTISLAIVALSPIVHISGNLKNQTINNTNDGPNVSNNDSSLVNIILDSFGLENRAFADNCSYGNCLNTSDICVAEGGSIAGSIQSIESSQTTSYPVNITIQSAAGITVSPLTQTFNNYSSGAPDSQTETLNYSGAAPAVSVTDDPGDSSGPYSGKGRKKFSMYATDSRRDWDGSSWGDETGTMNTAFTISVDHVNSAPTVNSISSDYSVSVANSSVTSNVPVNVSFSDVESNHVNVLLELSNDNFSTTLQSFTQNGVSAGTLVVHTFTNVSPGSYQWRATATEADAVGVCGEAGVNLSASAVRNINLNLPGQSSNNSVNASSSNPSAPSCSSQKPGTPSGITVASGPDAGQKTVTWFAPSGPVTDYSITYSDSPDTKKWGVVSTGNVTSYVISKLGGGKYYFWVNAINGCMPGDSISSSGAPLPPTGPINIIYIGMLGLAFLAAGSVFTALTFKPFN